MFADDSDSCHGHRVHMFINLDSPLSGDEGDRLLDEKSPEADNHTLNSPTKRRMNDSVEIDLFLKDQ